MQLTCCGGVKPLFRGSCSLASWEFNKAIQEFWHGVRGATESILTYASRIIQLRNILAFSIDSQAIRKVSFKQDPPFSREAIGLKAADLNLKRNLL